MSGRSVSRSFGLVFRLEMQRALQRRRLFILNVMMPLLLCLPIAFAGAPPQHAAAVFAVLFVLFGTFGAAIPALRDAENGIVTRLNALPLSPAGAVLGRAAAGACLDGLQLLPALAAALVAGQREPVAFFVLPIALFATILIANLTGLWIATIARSVAEGALFAAVAALLLLHASGAFRTPVPGSLGARIENIAPYRVLHEALLASLAGSLPPSILAGLLPHLLIAVGLTAVFARTGFRSLARLDAT
jgi:ABC-2 type transporter